MGGARAGVLMIVQIYEVASPEEAIAVARCGVDHVGVLVGSGRLPREVAPVQARRIFAALPRDVVGVGLSLSADPAEIVGVVEIAAPDIIHLGAAAELLSPDQTLALRRRFAHIRLMRSIPVTGEESLTVARAYEAIADFLLLDSHEPGDFQIGALGRTHDWSISRRIVDLVRIPVILAGGLSAENVADAIRTVRPAGVDSKTRTDRTDGAGKDLAKVRAFAEAARRTEPDGTVR